MNLYSLFKIKPHPIIKDFKTLDSIQSDFLDKLNQRLGALKIYVPKVNFIYQFEDQIEKKICMNS